MSIKSGELQIAKRSRTDEAAEDAKSSAIELLRSARNGNETDCAILLMLARQKLVELSKEDEAAFRKIVKVDRFSEVLFPDENTDQ